MQNGLVGEIGVAFFGCCPLLDWRELKVRANDIESFEHHPATMGFECLLLFVSAETRSALVKILWARPSV